VQGVEKDKNRGCSGCGGLNFNAKKGEREGSLLIK